MTHRSHALVLTICLGASIVACQRREAATAGTGAEATPAPAAEPTPQPAVASYDLQFLDTMSKHHQMAIDLAKMGQGKFAHKELEAMAKKMIADQEKEIAQMKQWRDQWYPGAPDAENMNMPGMSPMSMDISSMQTMSGKELDLMFIDMMIPHHQGAIEMARDAVAKAEHPEIKDLAQKVISAQQKEIEQMQQWKSKWSAK
jgi:uncharacterized protein (DUF305 family)